MSKSLKLGLGIVALLLVLGIGYVSLHKTVRLGTAVDCTQNTCFTSLGVTGTSQVDGTFITNGAVTQSGATTNTGSLTLGSGNTALTGFIGTTCNLIGSDSSQAASTTVAYDCAVSGLTSSYIAFAQLASTTARTSGSAAWFISAAKASTTAGYLTVLLTNYGPAAVPSATSVGSSTKVWAFK